MSEANNFYKEEQFSDYPSNWNVLTLKNLVSQKITYGIVQPGQHENAGIPLIRGVDYMNGWQDIGTFFKVAPSLHSQYARSVTRKGDVLLSIAGYAGEVAIVPEWILEANITQTTARISVDSDIADPKFVASFLSSQKGRNQSKRYTKGSAQEGLNLGDVENFYVPIPPLAEQKKIASILTSVDEVIGNTQKQIDKLQDLKKATMNELLTKGIGHIEFKDSELGRVPKNWDVKSISSLSSLITKGATPIASGDNYTKNGINFYRSINASEDGALKTKEIKQISENAHEKLRRSMLKLGDLAISIVGAKTGKTFFAITKKSELPGNINQNIALIRPNSQLIKARYLIYVFSSKYFQHQIDLELTTQAQPCLSLKQVGEFKVILPTVSEQTKIVEALDAITDLISDNCLKLEKFLSLKYSLMQDLLTGKLRVQTH